MLFKKWNHRKEEIEREILSLKETYKTKMVYIIMLLWAPNVNKFCLQFKGHSF